MYKQLLISLLILFTGPIIKAQDKSAGVIYYKQTNALRMPPGGGNVVINGGGAQMPDKVTTEYEFTYNANGARYQKYVSGDGGGAPGGMMIMIGGADRKVFYNFADNKVVEYVPFDGENYLMESKLGSASDTVQNTDETKEIIGFKCKKAIVKNKVGTTEIWYTTDVKINASPVIPYWTEGLVLAVKNDRVNVIATSAEFYKVKDKEFTIPKDGKPITADEFKTKQEELMKKMQNGSGRVMPFGGE